MAAIANDDTKLTIVLAPPTAASPGSKHTCPTCGALPATDADSATATAKAMSSPPAPQGNVHQWLRAAVLGASDGVVSTAALMLGVGAAARDADADDSGPRAALLAGVAGLVAGACSMAIGEYVSVHAQLDVELAELKRRAAADGGGAPPADKAAAELSRPGQAAAASALAFAAGAAVPLMAAWFVTGYVARVAVVAATASVALGVFGSLGAVLGHAPGVRAGLRAVVGGLVAMGITYGLMKLFRVHGV
ncbi:unnamed protein product [Urochloa humidicola]